MKIKVGVIFGGETVEHEVSIISAVQAMSNMNTDKYDIVPIYISKERVWYTGRMLADIEIYKDQFSRLADEYISQLPDPEMIYEKRNTCFDGMVMFIHSQMFRTHPIDRTNVVLLDSIWRMYADLCYQYGRKPIIEQMALLTGISRKTLWEWKNGKVRTQAYYTKNGEYIKDLPAWRLNHKNEEYVSMPSTAHSDMIEKWSIECEVEHKRGASEGGNIGDIFLLKANYGYVETAPKQIENPHQQVRTVEEIAEQYSEPLKGIPDLPDS